MFTIHIYGTPGQVPVLDFFHVLLYTENGNSQIKKIKPERVISYEKHSSHIQSQYQYQEQEQKQKQRREGDHILALLLTGGLYVDRMD
jgi:hypothetical protein